MGPSFCDSTVIRKAKRLRPVLKGTSRPGRRMKSGIFCRISGPRNSRPSSWSVSQSLLVPFHRGNGYVILYPKRRLTGMS